MSSINSKSLVYGSLLVGACAVLCVAIVAQAQYNTFDSDSNSDSDGSPILTQSELGKLVRNSAKAQNQQRYNQQQQQFAAAASRNLHNRHQAMQYEPTQHRRNYGGNSDGSGLNDFVGPVMGASAANGRGSNVNSNNDDDEDIGPNFGANFDGGNDGEGDRSQADGDGPALNLNQAASGYPGHGDYSEAANAGFGFGGASGYGSGVDSSDFGPSEAYGVEGRRAKSASSLMGSRNFGSDDDAGAPQYGPNSAINAGDNDDDARSGYAPESESSNDNDDE